MAVARGQPQRAKPEASRALLDTGDTKLTNRDDDRGELRFITYLAPSIPFKLFELVVLTIGKKLGVSVSLRAETRWSGPVHGASDPFSCEVADVGFLCSPPFLWLRERAPSPIDLIPAAPLFLDPRCRGRAVYYSDVIVPKGSAIDSFETLRGSTWAYNDSCSLSGYYNLLKRLAEMRSDHRFFGAVRRSGSHINSLRLVEHGLADGAAIDSNVLCYWLARDAKLRERIRVIESWGPCPVQPVVARAGLPPQLKARIAEALLTMAEEPASRRLLASFGVERFIAVSEADYESERSLLRACDGLLPIDETPVREHPWPRDHRAEVRERGAAPR